MKQKEQHLQRLVDIIRRKHYSLATERTYCGWVSRFWDAALSMPCRLTREEKIENFLTQLAKTDCAASTQNQAFDAIRFFFLEVLREPLGNIKALRAKRAATIRFAPDQETTIALLRKVPNVGGYPTNLIARLLYGCGMRVSEPLKLRLKDVDLARSRLLIYEAKGQQCRIVPLPCSLVRELRAQMAFAEKLWETDQLAGLPVAMPNRLGRKAPRNAYARGWYFVFPALRPCHHPRTHELVRYHLHEANVQRAVRIAADKVGLVGIITPHNLRHAYATHTMENGSNVRDVQSALGHKQLNTTMGYVHPDAMRVRSPLEPAPVALINA
jgi:site-specific recombinase XerD